MGWGRRPDADWLPANQWVLFATFLAARPDKLLSISLETRDLAFFLAAVRDGIPLG